MSLRPGLVTSWPWLAARAIWIKQHGHRVEVMLRLYAAWLEGATESDICAIKQAMESKPTARTAILVRAP